MDYNALIDLAYQVQGQLWVDKWVSTFHPGGLPCQLEGTFHYGAFNAGMKMVFGDGTARMVRFPRVGNVHHGYADEKVAVEVKALSLIREGTSIPVPKVQAWRPNAECPTRLMRADISDDDIEALYRQFANFLLQLFKLDFDTIGSLPSPRDGTESPVVIPVRPLTFKAHTILQNGGVDTFGMPRLFYLGGVRDDDRVLPVRRWTGLGATGPPAELDYDRGNFKLICDDDGEPPRVAARYFRCLDIFKRVLAEEEAKIPGHEERELSCLVQWSQDSGAMWLHMLLSAGFNDQRSFPFTQLRRHLGAEECAALDEYDAALEKGEEYKALVDSGGMTREEFIAMFRYSPAAQ
ncbi:phosphotransferase enzyme family protein [Parachaetomium inaequale]|uniref:Phosphotransferase enzyme family protein n=1 Tax=Parachaetomium inaequale TaxID=2588326 RepID=A0AAN6PLP5_9PEZI|nr:phosphotransferase enzyme family protein [Parachaetomium inaequale]